MVRYLRWYDKIVAQRPDAYIAITKTVQDRIKKYYSRESSVVYPPAGFAPKTQTTADEFFLVVSRLVPQKRVDIAVKAFNQLRLPLKIVGIGSEEEKLKALANSNIEFLGYLSDEQLADYYSRCRAVIICGEEDFNIVAVEAQSFGKPVIAYKSGGVTESVIEGKTGWFFPQQTKGSLTKTLQNINPATIDPQDCINNAKKFSDNIFRKSFKSYIEKTYEDYVRNG